MTLPTQNHRVSTKLKAREPYLSQLFVITGSGLPPRLISLAKTDAPDSDKALAEALRFGNLDVAASHRYTEATELFMGIYEIAPEPAASRAFRKSTGEEILTGLRPLIAQTKPDTNPGIKPLEPLEDHDIAAIAPRGLYLYRLDTYASPESLLPRKSYILALLADSEEDAAQSDSAIRQMCQEMDLLEARNTDYSHASIARIVAQYRMCGHFWISQAGLGLWDCLPEGPTNTVFKGTTGCALSLAPTP